LVLAALVNLQTLRHLETKVRQLFLVTFMPSAVRAAAQLTNAALLVVQVVAVVARKVQCKQATLELLAKAMQAVQARQVLLVVVAAVLVQLV
jgi:hypothetical protein